MDENAYRKKVGESGFALLAEDVPQATLIGVIAALDRLASGTATRRGQLYAARNLLQTMPVVAGLAASTSVLTLVRPILGLGAFPVRALLFDKVPGANWHVGWHQDQVIPVRGRNEVPGFTAWSVKRGVIHVRPPVEVLEKMLTLRIHLDNCGRDNGALRVIPGSHRKGIIGDNEITDIVAEENEVVCEARRGSVLAMRPLVLHSSTPATTPSHRRVIHLEFAAEPLPGGLEWPDVNAAVV